MNEKIHYFNLMKILPVLMAINPIKTSKLKMAQHKKFQSII